MEAFELVINEDVQKTSGYKIVRFKNKFHPTSGDTFKNIMVNALVRGEVLVPLSDKVGLVHRSVSLPKMEISGSAH